MNSFIKDKLITYDGMKFLLAAWYCLGVTTAAWMALASVSDQQSGLPDMPLQMAAEYIFVFWRGKLVALTIVLSFLAMVFYFNVLRIPFSRLVRQVPTGVLNRTNDRSFSRVRHTTYVSTFILTVVGFPLVGLVANIWVNILPAIATLLLTGITFALAHDQLAPTKPKLRLAHYSFDPRDFNVAAAAPLSNQVQRELQLAQKIGTSPMSAAARSFIAHGTRTSIWQGIDNFVRRVASAIGTDADNLRVAMNATEGIRLVLYNVCEQTDRLTIVTTDAEYEAIRTDVLGKCVQTAYPSKDIRLLVADISESIYDGSRPHQIVDAIMCKVRTARSEYPGHKLYVCTSHVFWKSGMILPVQQLRSQLEAAEELIIDGAQAFGNICVTEEDLSASTFYITSCHKWLLGTTSLGLIYQNPNRYQDELRSCGRLSELPRSFRGNTIGTININPYVALNASLVDLTRFDTERVAKHNHYLATAFREWLPLVGCMPVVNGNTGGIVVVRTEHARELEKALERRYHVKATAFDNSTIRFCFHYYHSENDVGWLIDLIADCLATISHVHGWI